MPIGCGLMLGGSGQVPLSGGGSSGVPGVVTSALLAEYVLGGLAANATTVEDSTGNGNVATLGPLPTKSGTAPAIAASGLQFTAASNTVLSLPAGSIVNENTRNFSAEVWLNPGAGTAPAVVFMFGDYNTYMHIGNDAKFFFDYSQAWDSSGLISSTTGFSSTGVHDFNAWYQIVATCDPSTGDISTYVNGAFETSLAQSGSPTPFNQYPMGFDNSSGLGDQRLIGNDGQSGSVSALIGEVRFYGKTLSDAEVLQNFNARKGTYGL